MEVRTTRVSWPVTGTASEKAGSAMRASQPCGSTKKSGSLPEAGSIWSVEENSRMSRTASQNDGVAMQAMEKMRITWSGHLSRYSAEMTPRMTAKNTAMMRPRKVSCSVTGRASATRWATEALLAP